MNEPTYFPGKDFPDREAWLARRAAKPHPVRPLTDGRTTVNLGINKLKRQLDAAGEVSGVARPRQTLVKSRTAYRRRSV